MAQSLACFFFCFSIPVLRLLLQLWASHSRPLHISGPLRFSSRAPTKQKWSQKSSRPNAVSRYPGIHPEDGRVASLDMLIMQECG